MAGKTKSMSQIKQLLLLKKQKISNRKAALQVGMDKETVKYSETPLTSIQYKHDKTIHLVKAKRGK